MNIVKTLNQHSPIRVHDGFKYADLAFLQDQEFVSAKNVTGHELSALKTWIETLRLTNTILMVEVNGFLQKELSDFHELPSDIKILSLTEASTECHTLLSSFTKNYSKNTYPFASLNNEITEGTFIYLDKNCQLSKPIHFLSVNMGGENLFSQPKRLIVLECASELTLIEEHVCQERRLLQVKNISNTIYLAKEAKLFHHKLQREQEDNVHLAHTDIQQQKESNVFLTNFSLGSRFARDETIVNLQESGATFHAHGFYYLNQKNQYTAHHLNVTHEAINTESHMCYKGLLDNRSTAVFHGKVIVKPHAEKIKASQNNHHLLLSNEAQVFAKPDLEIYAEDVQCKHAATNGQLNQAALLYLRSRGLHEALAMKLLLMGFFEDILRQVPYQAVRERIKEKVGSHEISE